MLDVTIDFESYYDKDVGFAKQSTPEYVGDPKFKIHMMGIKLDNSEIAIIEEHNIAPTLAWLDTQRPINLICQNVLFDGYVLHFHYNWHPDFYSDTAAMSRGLAPHASASLAKLSERLYPKNLAHRKGTELAQSKGVEDLHSRPGLFDKIATYCVQDVSLTYINYKYMLKRFPPNELNMIDLVSRMFCDPVLKVNMKILRKYYKNLQQRRDTVIAASAVDPKILASNPQFADYIENTLKLVVPKKISPSTGKPTPAFAKADLQYITFQKNNPQYQHIWDARQAVKSTIDITRCTRFMNVAKAARGMMPAALRYSAAHTHRLGGTDKTNLQNMPRGGPLRLSLEAPEKQVILVRDLSNIEARVLAVISDQLDLIKIFLENGDPYSVMAERIYGHPINKRDHPTERGVGKMAVLGLGYGMSGDKFRDTLHSGPLGMSPIHLSDPNMYHHIVYNVYRKINTGITRFWKQCDKFIYWMATADPDDPLIYKCLKVYKERIELPNGLSLHYPNLRAWQGGWGYDAKNGTTNIYGGKLTENIVQALAQIIIKNIMLETTRQLPKWRVALQVHDEILAVGPKKKVKKADRTIEKIMSTPPEWMPDLPLNSEGGWAKNYSK